MGAALWLWERQGLVHSRRAGTQPPIAVPGSGQQVLHLLCAAEHPVPRLRLCQDRLSQPKTQRVVPGASGKEESGRGRSKGALPVGDGGTGLYVNQSVVTEKWRHLWLSNPVPGAAATQISSIFNTVKLTLPYLLHRVVIRDEVEVKSCVCSTELVEDQHQGVHRE